MLESFSVETFTDRIGEQFKISVEAGAVNVELADVVALAPPPDHPARTSRDRAPFSVEFLGPGDSMLPQGTYRFENPVLGAFEIFVVPISRDSSGVRYEAVFT